MRRRLKPDDRVIDGDWYSVPARDVTINGVPAMSVSLWVNVPPSMIGKTPREIGRPIERDASWWADMIAEAVRIAREYDG